MPNFSPARYGTVYEIPFDEWGALRDIYKASWPRYIINFYTIQNYINWGTKNPKMNDVRIFSTDEQWRQHGTYVIEDRNALRYNVMFHTLSSKNHALMLKALKMLPSEPAFTLTAYLEQVRPVAELYLKGLGINSLDDGYCPTLLYYLPKEKGICLKISPIEGIVLKALTEDYVSLIDSLWPHRYPGSDYMIRRLIRYNLTLGAFDAESGQLCAWAMQRQVGTIGLLQVEESHKRRGLGELVLRALTLKMAQRGLDATATIMATNIPSSNLFQKLGFTVIDQAYWFDKPKISRK